MKRRPGIFNPRRTLLRRSLLKVRAILLHIVVSLRTFLRLSVLRIARPRHEGGGDRFRLCEKSTVQNVYQHYYHCSRSHKSDRTYLLFHGYPFRLRLALSVAAGKQGRYSDL